MGTNRLLFDLQQKLEDSHHIHELMGQSLLSGGRDNTRISSLKLHQVQIGYKYIYILRKNDRKESGGVSTRGSVEETWRCSTEGHDLVDIMVMGCGWT